MKTDEGANCGLAFRVDDNGAGVDGEGAVAVRMVPSGEEMYFVSTFVVVCNGFSNCCELVGIGDCS